MIEVGGGFQDFPRLFEGVPAPSFLKGSIMFPERTIAQTVALLKIQVRLGVRSPALSVQMVEGTRAEDFAYRLWAIRYLQAKAEKRKLEDPLEQQRRDFYGEAAGRRCEDDPRPAD